MPQWGDLQVDQLHFMAETQGETPAYRDLHAATALILVPAAAGQ